MMLSGNERGAALLLGRKRESDAIGKRNGNPDGCCDSEG
jgi:hypothetical protein